ncbi:MAG TPA: endonuclease/exonuclease/phosphatase family protein [Natronosporangium sp.]
MSSELSQPARPPVQLRVVSYNIHGLRDDRAALVAVVRELAPDVLLLQEAPQRFQWRHKCAELAHEFGLVVGAGGQPGRGNLLLTNLRVRVTDSWCRWYPLTPGRHLRGAVFARCTVGGARFVVAGSHLATDPVERPSQAKLFKAMLAEVDGPVVVGADLNDEPDGEAWRVVASGLVDACGDDSAVTFSCTEPRRRIDAIFVDPRVEVTDFRVIDTPQARRASDHFPVVADLRLPVSD